LRLYPRAWRQRYEDEMLAVLEAAAIGWKGRMDLVGGAIDARIHSASRVPGVAALIAGGLWTTAGAGVLAQPAPPEWPGHLLETLPMGVVAIVAGAVALVGCWGRSGDRAGRHGAVVATVVIVSQLVWAATLVAGFTGAGDRATLAIGQAIGAMGCLVMGFLLLRAGGAPIGLILVAAPPVLLFGWPIAWLAFGLAWTVIGFMLLLGLDRDESGALPA
jgi:hypothetical protein